MTTSKLHGRLYRGLLTALVLLATALIPSTQAQTAGTVTGTIVGRATDASSKVAFDGVRVTVTAGGVDYQTTTDQQGSYTLVNVPPTASQVTFTYIGLPVQTMPVKIVGGDVVRVDMSMGQGLPAGRTEDTVKMSELVVSGSLLGTARALNE